jgi:hypothetical protein
MVFHVPQGRSQTVFEGNSSVAISQFDQYINYILDITTEPIGNYAPDSPFNTISEFVPGTLYVWETYQAFDITT